MDNFQFYFLKIDIGACPDSREVNGNAITELVISHLCPGYNAMGM